MTIGGFLESEQLTNVEYALAISMCLNGCDKQPCCDCSRQNSETKGPGGIGCPTGNLLSTQPEVSQILKMSQEPKT